MLGLAKISYLECLDLETQPMEVLNSESVVRRGDKGWCHDGVAI